MIGTGRFGSQAGVRRHARGLCLAAALGSAGFASAQSALADVDAEPHNAEAAPPFEVPPGEGTITEFIGCELPDGSRPLVSVSSADMPWRVSIGMPRNSPRYGSRTAGREAAIDAMRLWERAIQTQLPWFRLEFAKKDRQAHVQIKWKRRTTGSAVGRAGPTCWTREGQLRAGGLMEISVQPCPTCRPLEVNEVGLLVAHEFGHVLGLGHCLECESAMNYSWQTRGRSFVTGTDVDAIVRRFTSADRLTGASDASFDPDQAVEEAKGAEPIDFRSASCESLSLSRSCSDRRGGARKKSKIGGLSVFLAGSRDGRTLLLITPDATAALPGGAAAAASNDRYHALAEQLEGHGVRASKSAPVVANGRLIGYFIEFDGDAWSALGL